MKFAYIPLNEGLEMAVSVEVETGLMIAISIEAKEGEEDAVASILHALVQPTMAEAGVRLFVPYSSPSNPKLFFIYELYVDENAWDAHQETTHFKAAIKELLPRVAKRERVPFLPLVLN